jgi:hypothetical protein
MSLVVLCQDGLGHLSVPFEAFGSPGRLSTSETLLIGVHKATRSSGKSMILLTCIVW